MKIEEHQLNSRSGEYSRKIWLLEAAGGTAGKMGIFLDGEFYLNRMDAPSILVDLQKSGAISPMVCAFVSHVNGEARHQDLTCNPRYSHFVATDLVQWLRSKYETLLERGHLIAGPSLGGLASAFIALSRPEIFSSCLSHSGSFWWKGEWLKNNLPRNAADGGRFWLSVGNKELDSGVSHPPTGLRQEVTQVAACECFSQVLEQDRHIVHYEVHEGGHEFGPWKDELPRALNWLLR